MSKLIIISGATTYYGSHLAYHLVKENTDLLCLVEAVNEAAAKVRLAATLANARAAHEDRSESSELSFALPCDPDLACCGLSQAGMMRIREAVASHNDCQFWCFGSAHDQVENWLQFAQQSGFQRFVYVSSAYAGPSLSGEVAECAFTGEPEIKHLAHFHEAERSVATFCQQQGLAFSILRTPLAAGPALTKKQEGIDNPFTRFVRALYEKRDALQAKGQPLVLQGDPSTELNLMPADHFLADVDHLLAEHFPAGPYYHLTGNVSVRADFALNYLAENMGIPGISLRPDACPEPHSLAAEIMALSDFSALYLVRPHHFCRTLPGRRGVTRFDFFSMVYELRRGIEGETNRDLFSCDSFASNGAMLQVYHGGGQNKPVLLLVNAIGMPVDVWCRLAKRLGDRYSLYSWESRGVPSCFLDAGDGPLSLDDQLDDCIAVMDHFKLDSACVVGWCAGAQLSTRLAATYPNRVKKLILINGTFNLQDPSYTSDFMNVLTKTLAKLAKNRKYAQMYYRLNYGARRIDLADDEPGQLDLEYDPALFHLTSFPFKDPESLYQYARLVKQVHSEQGDGWLVKISQPTMVISGSRDRTVGSAASRHVAKIIEARARLSFHELADGDHYTPCYHEQVPQLLEKFIQEVT